jgi:hypothetical protein
VREERQMATVFNSGILSKRRVAKDKLHSSLRSDLLKGSSMFRLAMAHLRELTPTWAFAALLPVPLLLATDPVHNADIKCLYLGLASGWLAVELFRYGGLPESRPTWCAKLLAIGIAITANVSLFIVLGLSVGVRAHFPFPLMAALSATPAIGLAPWLATRIRQPYAVIILGATIVVGAKLAACVVARFVYGPNYIAEGYVAGDWRTAKLMITLFWVFTVALSLVLFIAGYKRAKSAS